MVKQRSKKESFLQETYFFKSVVSTVLVDRTQGLGGNLHFHELTEFRNPDALLLKVGENGTIDSLSDVTTNTALFLGKTGAMDTTTFVRHGTSDDANSGHGNRSYLLMRERQSSVFLPKVKNNRTKALEFILDCTEACLFFCANSDFFSHDEEGLQRR